MALFSQRYGYKPVKKNFQRESVSENLRTTLWNVLNVYIWGLWEHSTYASTPCSARINGLFQRLWFDFFNRDLDHLPDFHYKDSREDGYDKLKEFFFQCQWFEVFDFLEFMASDPECFITPDVAKVINNVLERENSAYRFIGNKIVEITDKNQIEAMQRAFDVAVPIVQAHLNTALSMLSDKKKPDYRNSIKESISAVEATCREISNQPKATLGDALKKISNFHPALQKGFSSFYGYDLPPEN